jgi:hypothetical protein
VIASLPKKKKKLKQKIVIIVAQPPFNYAEVIARVEIV